MPGRIAHFSQKPILLHQVFHHCRMLAGHGRRARTQGYENIEKPDGNQQVFHKSEVIAQACRHSARDRPQPTNPAAETMPNCKVFAYFSRTRAHASTFRQLFPRQG